MTKETIAHTVDKIKLETTEKIRDRLHNLDLPHKQDTMKKLTEEFLMLVEGKRLKVYFDTELHPTIGCGFNMDAVGAKEAFDRILARELDANGKKFDFDNVLTLYI